MAFIHEQREFDSWIQALAAGLLTPAQLAGVMVVLGSVWLNQRLSLKN